MFNGIKKISFLPKCYFSRGGSRVITLWECFIRAVLLLEQARLQLESQKFTVNLNLMKRRNLNSTGALINENECLLAEQQVV